MTTVARPPSQPDDVTPSAGTRPSRLGISRNEVDYRKLHPILWRKRRLQRDLNGKSSGREESQLSAILWAIADVCESLDERIAHVPEAITDV